MFNLEDYRRSMVRDLLAANLQLPLKYSAAENRAFLKALEELNARDRKGVKFTRPGLAGFMRGRV